MRIAAVECGGTSFKVAVCNIVKADSASAALANGQDVVDIAHRCRVLTVDGPVQTLAQVVAFLAKHGPYDAAGIASFGPVSVKPSDERYGKILDSSPKLEWRGVDILGAVQAAVGADCPILMDTDVNAPAAAEYHALVSGAKSSGASSLSSCAYVTIGTGVGVGLVVNGKTVHGHMHPEGGHVPVAPLVLSSTTKDKSSFAPFTGYSWGKRPGSKCPFAGEATVEGLASSVALTERYHYIEQQKKQSNDRGTDTSTLDMDRVVLQTVPDDHEIWEHAAYTIASLCTTLLLTLSMEHIVLGGGVMQRTCLLSKIRSYTCRQLNGYLDLGSGGDESSVQRDLERIISTSRRGDDAGLYGAIFLAQQVLQQKDAHRNTDSVTTVKIAEKQAAFRVGLWQGLLVGALTTALAFQNGWFGTRRTKLR